MGWGGQTLQSAGRRLAAYASLGRFGNRAHGGVFRRGFLTGFHKRVANCPYENKKAGRRGEKNTYSSGYIKAWTEGYRLGQEARSICDKGVIRGGGTAVVVKAPE